MLLYCTNLASASPVLQNGLPVRLLPRRKETADILHEHGCDCILWLKSVRPENATV